LLFSLMSSGALLLVRIDEFMAVLHDFTIDDLFNNSVVGLLVNFNIRVLTMLWVTRAFLFSTPMMNILHGLRSIKVPSIIVNLIAITYRYIFVLAEEFLAVSIAKELRAPAPRSMKARFEELSVIYASTFNRALRRSITVQTAISLRGTIEQFATRTSRINAAKSITFVCGAISLIGVLFTIL
nr:CbiQ family ECF transporter T component [Candidatus Sigynarchaeota archaeon]